MTVPITNYRALVCGASRGIGRACAGVLARRGASVSLLARDEAALEAVASDLDRSRGQQHAVLPGDMGDPGALESLVAGHLKTAGPVHILVHNSGGPAAGPVFEAEAEAFTGAFRQHVLSARALARVVVPSMTEAKYGRIVNIISTSVKQPLPGLGVSNTIRGAMASWAKTLASELAPRGITVNNVLPGATRTERLQSIIQNRAQRQGLEPAEVERAMLAEIPAGRFAEPEEIAEAVAFLASPAAGYITGINVPVDGGRTSSL